MDVTFEHSLLNNGIFTLFGEIDNNTSLKVAEFILHHNLHSECDYLQLIINSPGGCLVNSWCIVDLIDSSIIPIHTKGIGQVSSGALLILMSGQKGSRTIGKNCTLMSHQFIGECEGKVHELESVIQSFQRSHEQMIQFYLEHSCLTREQIIEKLLPAHDVFLTPYQALQIGMVDRIL
jgi:ATP-dependent Clp protease protease subunit